MRPHESSGHEHAKTTIFSVGFAVWLQQVCTSVGCRLGDEDGSTDWLCVIALKELFVEMLLDVDDKPLLSGVGGGLGRRAGLFICCVSVV